SVVQAEEEKDSLVSSVAELRRRLEERPQAPGEPDDQEARRCQETVSELRRLRAELSELESRCAESEGRRAEERERAGRLQRELRQAAREASESRGGLARAHDELASLSEELALLYHRVCLRSNLTPSRVTLEHARALRTPPASGEGSPTADQQEGPGLLGLSAVIRSQIRHLQAAVEASRQRACLQLLSPGAERDKEALLDEVLKLRSLLSTKREQIATLRTVLKANKQVGPTHSLSRAHTLTLSGAHTHSLGRTHSLSRAHTPSLSGAHPLSLGRA
ncbi:hypothetical protein chiPu_0029699, partial [Chiloscyllium punctatum]|nr:hypothetical protein [Chiloscyllium punctatum]